MIILMVTAKGLEIEKLDLWYSRLVLLSVSSKYKKKKEEKIKIN